MRSVEWKLLVFGTVVLACGPVKDVKTLERGNVETLLCRNSFKLFILNVVFLSLQALLNTSEYRNKPPMPGKWLAA